MLDRAVLQSGFAAVPSKTSARRSASARANPGVCVNAVRFGFVDRKMAKATVRPMMISPDRAVEAILGVIKRRPATRTYPLAMEGLVSIATA
jgi:hypothetical protein